MSRNGSGTYSLVSGNPVVTGTTISSTTHNTTMSDISTALTDSLDRDGQTVVTGAIDHNGLEIILDVDGDTSITADTDDRIDIKIAGADDFQLSANKFDVLAGSVLKVSGQIEQTKGADIASATELPVNIDGNIFDVTGTTTIASFSERGIGSIIYLQFDGILTLTHHATDLVLLTGANRTTAAGDIGIYYQYAAGDWREVYFSGGTESASASPIFITEQSAASADVAGDGQIWVDDAVPNTLMFTNDAGADEQISGLQSVVQIVNVTDGDVATGTTLIPNDDTIPQSTEGTQFMSLAITPKSATNILKVEVTTVLNHSVTGNFYWVCLFQDATANAVSSAADGVAGGGYNHTNTFSHYMVAGTTSATTFKVRAGPNASGTLTFNGQTGSRMHGGVYASSITITEYLP